VVGVAASAGGPAALAAILPSVAGLEAPVLIVQHLDPRSLDDFRDWMARVSPLPVEIPEDRALLRAGTVYIAAPGTHLKLGLGRRAVLETAPARPHCPSADELFISMALHAGSRGIGVVLTGIGDDGAVGLRELHHAGGTTLVQDRESSAVYGMPLAAKRLEAADQVLPLARMGAAIHAAVKARTG
jgi:two-component system chemotaxis response regulator CheB